MIAVVGTLIMIVAAVALLAIGFFGISSAHKYYHIRRMRHAGCRAVAPGQIWIRGNKWTPHPWPTIERQYEVKHISGGWVQFVSGPYDSPEAKTLADFRESYSFVREGL